MPNTVKDLRISTDDLNMEPSGSGNDTRACLLGHVVINGVYFHVEAYAVEEDDDGTLYTVDPPYGEHLESAYELSGDSLQTVSIGGRDYVLVVYPYAK